MSVNTSANLLLLRWEQTQKTLALAEETLIELLPPSECTQPREVVQQWLAEEMQSYENPLQAYNPGVCCTLFLSV